jgi:hypothetical protein
MWMSFLPACAGLGDSVLKESLELIVAIAAFSEFDDLSNRVGFVLQSQFFGKHLYASRARTSNTTVAGYGVLELQLT